MTTENYKDKTFKKEYLIQEMIFNQYVLHS